MTDSFSLILSRRFSLKQQHPARCINCRAISLTTWYLTGEPARRTQKSLTSFGGQAIRIKRSIIATRWGQQAAWMKTKEKFSLLRAPCDSRLWKIHDIAHSPTLTHHLMNKRKSEWERREEGKKKINFLYAFPIIVDTKCWLCVPKKRKLKHQRRRWWTQNREKG